MIINGLIFVIIVLTIISGMSFYGFYKAMKYNIETEESSVAMYDVLFAFRRHLEVVYNKDTYYGDETLKKLLEHTRDVEEYVKDFIVNNSLPENDFIDTDDEEELDNDIHADQKA